jgi:folate-binding protein YgfZ
MGLSWGFIFTQEENSLPSHYTVLNKEALLHISGPDSQKFLQGQTTCDAGKVSIEQATPGAYCTPKGRVVCDFILSQIGDNHFALRLRREILQASAATFRKYIIFSKAELSQSDTHWKIYGCWGSEAKQAVYSALGVENKVEAVSARPYSSYCGDGFVIVQIDQAGTQFECYIDAQNRAELAHRLEGALSSSDENHWESLQIEQGVGRIEAATSEDYIPQMLNYDLTGHISFDKGCYTGQEVVARMHYRGKAKKRLYRASSAETQAFDAGTALYSSSSSQSVGSIVNSAIDETGQAIALIVAPVESDTQSLHVGDPTGPLVSYLGTG